MMDDDIDDKMMTEIIGVPIIDPAMQALLRKRAAEAGPRVRQIPMRNMIPASLALSCEGEAGETKTAQVTLHNHFRGESFHATDFSAAYAAVDGGYCGFYSNLPAGATEGERPDPPAQAEFQLVEEARESGLSDKAVDDIALALEVGRVSKESVALLLKEIREERTPRRRLRIQIAPPPGSLTEIVQVCIGCEMQASIVPPGAMSVSTSAFASWREARLSTCLPGTPLTVSVRFRAAARWVGVFHGSLLR